MNVNICDNNAKMLLKSKPICMNTTKVFLKTTEKTLCFIEQERTSTQVNLYDCFGTQRKQVARNREYK